MTGDKRLMVFETPPEGVRVRCECGSDLFYLAVHAKLSCTLVTRTAECARCGHREPIDGGAS